MRKTGIDIIGDSPWGTHLCHFYRNREDLIDILVPYFKAGLENNEFCMWITSEPLRIDDAKRSLERVVRNLDNHIKNGQIEIIDASQWYTKSGKFEPDKVLQGWIEKENQALKKGFDGLRLTGNTLWLKKRDWKDFADYEAMINNVIGKYRMIAICSYSLDKCGASEVIDVVSNHQFALIRRERKWELIEITERKRAEEKLKITMAELARSNTELEQFASIASHDLKEPLRMVASYVHLLAKRYKGRLDSDADEFITYAMDGTNRMNRLINDLLAYSQVDSKYKDFAPTDCEAIFKRSIANLKETVEENGTVVTHDPLPTVMGEESQLIQLFQNLINNAIKFHDNEPPRVHVSAKRIEKSKLRIPQSEFRNPNSAIEKGWVFTVRDNGIGISPEFFDRIFNPFQRLHTRTEFSGTGIGLAICKKIVERHNGHIWVDSEPGKGSTFYFTIPANE